MCLISVLPKGTSKSGDYVENFIISGMRSNREGSGFMYAKNGDDKVFIDKGYFDIDKLLQAIRALNLTEEDELVVHHRIGTSGKVSRENCHPFVITNEHQNIIMTKGYTFDTALVHNGIFRNIDEYMRLNPDFSDTYAFTRYIANPAYNLMTNQPEEFQKQFSVMLGWSKICLMHPVEGIQMIGDFIQDNGYFHSNQGYKNYNYIDIGGVEQPKKNSAGGGKQLTLPSVYDQAKINKEKLKLTGHYININNFNATHFIFTDPDYMADSRAYEFHNFDEAALLNYLSSRSDQTGYYVGETHLKELIYHPKGAFEEFYKEYFRFINTVTISKSFIKKAFNMLNSNRHKSFDHEFRIKNKIVSKFTLINVVLSFNEQVEANISLGRDNCALYSPFNMFSTDYKDINMILQGQNDTTVFEFLEQNKGESQTFSNVDTLPVCVNNKCDLPEHKVVNITELEIVD